jgi:regulatory protein
MAGARSRRGRSGSGGEVIRETSDTGHGTETERARDAALVLLTVRARSVGELRDRLRRKSFAEDVCERVIADLMSAGLLDDMEFARLWADERVRLRPVGRRRLTAELRARGVDPAVIDEVAAEVYEEHPEEELARRALRKRTRSGDADVVERDRQRLEGFLLRRGFSYATVARVLKGPNGGDG